MLLIVIVLLTGTKVFVNPSEISALVQAREGEDPLKHYAPAVRCVVEMTSRHEFTTTEECASIEKRIHELKEKRP